MSRGIHFVTHVAIFMDACMSSLGALGAWTPENKAALVAQIDTNCGGTMVGPNGHPISQWNVEKVTAMNNLFAGCPGFNEDISDWDVSKVYTFEYMFLRTTAFNQPLGSWNTSKATDFWGMFLQATAFNQPLGSWNTEKATEFYGMFYQATAFNQPLGSWNTEKATTFSYMFKDTSVLIKTTAYWDTTNAQSGRYLSPQQPCPAGYDQSQTFPNGGARKGTLTARCPDGCSVTGYYEDANGFCRNDCVSQCLVCKNVNECEAGQCNPGYQFDAQCTACPNPGIGEKFTATAGSCFVTPCPAVAGEYYTTNGDCTKMSCTKRDSNQYYDKNETITRDDCSVATCPTDQTPAADGLSCEDETKSKVSETGDDAMIGTIMISETGDDAMIGTIMIVGSVIGALVLLAVVGIVVFCVIKRKRKNKRRDLGNRESKFDVELEAVTNNDEPVSRPSPSIEYREKEL